MSTPLSTQYAQAGNKASSFAPIYPSQLGITNLDDFRPGSYGTYKDGVWQKLGTIDQFGPSYTVSPPEAVDGSYTWSSDHIKSTSVVFNGTIWVPGEDGAGTGQVGTQYTDSSDTMFHVTSGDAQQYEMAPGTLGEIVNTVKEHPGWQDWRFVTGLTVVDGVLAFGGSTKNASCVVTGSAEAVTDEGAGKLSAGLSITDSNVTEMNANYPPGGTPVAFAMYLYQIDKHGPSMNNDPQ